MELLSPAGNFEKLKSAILFGADAVYFGGASFGLRAFAGNFDPDQMQAALKYLHERGKRGYVAVNVFPNTTELEAIEKYLKFCEDVEADGVIISDAGIFDIARKTLKKTPISISTQANTTNLAAVNFWASLGAARVIMAREVGRESLSEIVKNANCEIETFIHGAICVSMSGRCLISNYMTKRDANKGECTHPCRFKYALMEETREGQYMPVYEDERGTYLYNSRDLCLINRIGELVKMGVKSGKIEGRMKSVMYASIVTGVYRKAIDSAAQNPDGYKADEYLLSLLASVSNRGYTEGFYAGAPDDEAINPKSSAYSRGCDFLAVVVAKSGEVGTSSAQAGAELAKGEIACECRAKFIPNENITILTPNLERIEIKADEIFAKDSLEETQATRPNYPYIVRSGELAGKNIPAGSLLLRFK